MEKENTEVKMIIKLSKKRNKKEWMKKTNYYKHEIFKLNITIIDILNLNLFCIE